MHRASSRAVAWSLCMATVALVACGPPQYHYLKSSDMDAYFRVPNDWTLFSEREVKEARTESLIPPVVERISWTSAFDASDRPSLSNLFTPADAPVGYAEVRALNAIQYGDISLNGLRNFVLPLDEWLVEGQAEPLNGVRDEPFERSGMHGTRATWAVELQGGPIVYDQIALLDPDRSRVFLLVFSCATNCYSDNKREIDQIVTSLTVGEE